MATYEYYYTSNCYFYEYDGETPNHWQMYPQSIYEPGVITDGNDESAQFTVGEPLGPEGAPLGSPFQGTVVVDGVMYVLQGEAVWGSYTAYAVSLPPENSEDLVFFYPQQIEKAPFAVCFALGTPIATPDGERAVEALQAGDLILTADGRPVTVKWIGRQTVHKLFTRELSFRPVRIRAGALADNVPHADLVVTADHGLLIDDLMVQAGALVNDLTIERVPMSKLSDRETYYHIETDGHDVILAAGAPAETFVNNVSRTRFDNYAEYEALYGHETLIEEINLPRVKAARQLPARIAQRLAARAGASIAAA